MPLGECYKIGLPNTNLHLYIYKGHFATSHSHMNYFIDVASNKASIKEAKEIAGNLAEHYKFSTAVDTILCLDNTEVIGAYLAEELTASDLFVVNSDNNIFVLTPEHVGGSQLYFRDNTAPMIRGKNVLILAASVVTGYTAQSAVEAVRYYGGTPTGICSVFSRINECVGIPVHSVFDTNDLPDYVMSPTHNCPMCARGEKIDALVNSFGCSAL
ncbi:MAG: orotate phosphoribosyltransferase [Oscillospiraceae bacterium]|nr:orotate phosphoribosyltransferase [Oscillospiraceae bacterium]